MIVVVCEHYENEEAIVLLVDTNILRNIGNPSALQYADLLEQAQVQDNFDCRYGEHGLQSSYWVPQCISLPCVVDKLVDLWCR